MAERRYCKNTVPGRQGRGKKYPAKVRAEVVMAMIGTNSICAVARKYGVPESTIRSWVAEEAKKPDGEFAKARAEAAREIAARAALGAKAQVSYLQQRAAENQRAAEIRTKLQQRLDEDARARNYELGVLLKSEEENLQDAAETGLVIRSAPGTYDRQLTDEERTELEKQLERYESLAMSDKDAAKVTAVLLTAAEKAAALVEGRRQRPERGPGGADGAAGRGRAAGGGAGWQRNCIKTGWSSGGRSPSRQPLCAAARTKRCTAGQQAEERAMHW